ncbi:KpsF/GutQ family sugar-phosphate isomerase [Aquibium sp. A9E412]|uniref:KpsF/GutQ family sugar-phosphate isomerase n=1 Tax=Aquibium sp. A9E412 TaxID=2976767 RepID=UPI0025B13A1C|nr:KpsF/GutQ family sugar-phosphate isomerase [Aquibium sp. A9E412]MDN2566844.1 KpsF/GutQ family sugar-phosphate isomerase [Aquibium sp. A9E412]
MTGIVPPSDETADKLADEMLAHGRRVVEMEAEGLTQLAGSIGPQFVAAAKALLNLTGRVVVSGVGKSGHVAGKIAATLASTGTPAFFVHAAEAAHGDMGMISEQDVVMLISNSGETSELVPIIQHVTRMRVPLIGISSGADSLLLRNATVPLLLPRADEACPVGIAPTTSTTMTLALGDALAMVVMQRRGFSRDDFRLLHPGGLIGLRLMRVSEMMHRGERLPLVGPETSMPEVIMTMTTKSFGIAGVVDGEGSIVGVITDGDLRRNIERLTSARARHVMTVDPRVIPASTLAEDALKFLNAQKVTALFVIDDAPGAGRRVPVGLVHVHDFLRLGLS